MKSHRRPALIVLFLAAFLASPTAGAHPHMFVDARSELELDDDGRLIAVRTAMVIDQLTTLYVLEENGLTSFAEPLTDAQSAAIREDAVSGLREYDFFTDLEIDGEQLDFAHAAIGEIGQVDAQLAITLELTLETPQNLDGREIELALYDPTYFASVRTVAAPVFSAPRENCRVELITFEPSRLDEVSLIALGALSREETPEDPRIGERFADKSTITCAP